MIPRQVADAVAVAVLIRAGIDLVEDLAVPPLVGRAWSSSATAAQGSDASARYRRRPCRSSTWARSGASST